MDEYKTNYVTNAYGEIDTDFYVNRAKRLRADATADMLSRLIGRLKLGVTKRNRRAQLRVSFNH